MFNESWPWKRDLAAAVERLEIAGSSPNLGIPDHKDPAVDYEEEAEALYKVERDVMTSCFAVRRLLGMPYKVTKDIRKEKASVTDFALREGCAPPDALDALDCLDLYDLDNPTRKNISATQMCNLFVHSHVLAFDWRIPGLESHEVGLLDEDDPRLSAPVLLGGFFVATDTTSMTHLTLVDLTEMIRIFNVVSQDEVSELVIRRDHRGRRYLVSAR